MANELLLHLSGIGVRMGGRAILSGVDLAVFAGEVVTLIGPNGAGKTTLLRVALGLLPAADGRIVQRPGLRVGYMPQRLHIDDTMPLTVRRFMSLGGAVPPGARRAIAEEVGAVPLLDRPVQAVSGGEFQRVLLARALLRQPDLLVLDEPVQGVDITGQAELYDLINDIRVRRGCGVLIVTHDLHVVMAGADRVICLNHHVCCTGAPEDVRTNPEFLALFPNVAVGALAPYTHHHDHAHTPSGAIVPLDEAGGGDGERPEDHTHG